jgi:16S rRNA processing protein RimM
MSEWDDCVLVGRIARTHGNRGQVIVNPDTDFVEERFRVGSVLLTSRGGRVEELRITESRIHRGRPVIGIHGVESMNEAEELAGLELRVPASELAVLPEGSYYRHELVGCEVHTASGERVGEITGVEGEMTSSRLVVRSRFGEVLIPLAVEICVRIDVPARRVVIDPPEGLLEVNRRP